MPGPPATNVAMLGGVGSFMIEQDPWAPGWLRIKNYPLVICSITLEHGPFIADLPTKDGDFP